MIISGCSISVRHGERIGLLSPIQCASHGFTTLTASMAETPLQALRIRLSFFQLFFHRLVSTRRRFGFCRLIGFDEGVFWIGVD
jgi:hypothetical protein